MDKTAFYNSDGDFLIVPHHGTLYIKTLLGRLTVRPREICVIPRGITFSIDLEGDSRGWVAELFGHHLSLPELGPIGANGLANPSDFEYPVAWYEDKEEQWKVFFCFIIDFKQIHWKDVREPGQVQSIRRRWLER